MTAARVFVLDNYDSFTFNLVEYFKRLGAEVLVYRNDVAVEKVGLESPDLIVISPGPSVPKNAGNLIPIVQAYAGKIPLLGVCLGHQGIIEAFGGTLRLLDRPVHGKASSIDHQGQGLFASLPNPMEVGRYHSLVGDHLPECFDVTAKTSDGIIMAIAHKTQKIFGVQFHPESILSAQGEHGLQLLANVLTWAKTA